LNWKYDDIVEDDPGKHLLKGFYNNANLLEIMYNVIDEQTVKVFHAMKLTITPPPASSPAQPSPGFAVV